MSAPEPLGPSRGLNVVHLFCHPDGEVDVGGVRTAVEESRAAGLQVVTVSIIGAKADLCFMVLGTDLWALRSFQSKIQAAGLLVSESYVSVTEVSEYAAGTPEQILHDRLWPVLPPDRGEQHNWYALAYDVRLELMRQHGAIGRTFKGRILQVVTGSTGLDDWEWGVTLFGVHVDDLKECVYSMRFDEASTLYAEFGSFYTGLVGTIDEVLAASLA